MILVGKKIDADVRAKIKAEVESLKGLGIVPGLATLLVGDDAASQIYVASKHKACREAGLASFNHTLPKDAATETVLKKVDELNGDPRVHGMLIQLPLPPHVNAERVLES